MGTAPYDARRCVSTYAQDEWLRSLDAPRSDHNMLVAFRFAGTFDAGVLRAALEAMIARHEAMRTGFDITPTMVWQDVWPSCPIELPNVDLSQLPGDARPSALVRLMTEAVAEVIELSRPPLWRMILVRMTPDRHVLVTTWNHVIFDGASSAVVLRDLIQLYAAARSGAPAALPHLAMQPGDVAAEEHKQTLTPEATRYWRDSLSGPLPRLPADTGQRAPTGLYARSIPTIGADVTEAAIAAGAPHEASLPTILRAAVVASLAPYLPDSVVVALAYSNRRRPELQPLIGLLADQLPLHIDVSGNPTFAELIGRLRAAERLAKQFSAPLGLIIQAARQPERAQSGRIFDITVNYTPPAQPEPAHIDDPRITIRPSLLPRSGTLDRPFSATPRLGYNVSPQTDGTVPSELWGQSIFSLDALDALGRRLTSTLRALTQDPRRGIRD